MKNKDGNGRKEGKGNEREKNPGDWGGEHNILSLQIQPVISQCGNF